MSDDLNCPFCGSQNLKSGGDDKFVGVWCLDCQATGPNHYGRFDWNTRADTAAAQVAAAYERAADLCVDQFQAHLDLVITGNPDNARNRESAANMAEKLSHEIRAIATDTQTDALEQVRKEAALKALADMGQEWDADTAAAQVAAAYERAADSIESRQKGYWESDWVRGNNSAVTACAAHIRALATDTQTNALEQVRREAERAGYERGVREALQTAMSDKAMRDAAFDAMWKVATETYSLEATNENGARYSITGDVVNALWYASMQSMIALLDKPTPDPDEQTKAQDLAFRKAVSS